MAEQISAIEQTRLITADVLSRYLPPQDGGTPAPMGGMRADDTMSTERELLYKVLFDMRADINDLKRMMSELMHNTQAPCGPVHDVKALLPTTAQSSASAYAPAAVYAESEDVTDEPPREMTKADMQREQIIRALRRNNGRRREAPPNCSCPNVRSTARSRSWASKIIRPPGHGVSVPEPPGEENFCAMKIKFAITALCAALLTGCGVAIKYSLSGASIPPDARTFSVAYFPNNATMVAPILSSTLTDALVDMFTRRTRLMQVEEGGDFAFEGEIINYTSTTASVSSDDYALLNRLTITIKVRFTNALDEKQSWNRTFTAYEDYESTRLLTEVEGELIPQIVDKLVTDIFQASASNW